MRGSSDLNNNRYYCAAISEEDGRERDRWATLEKLGAVRPDADRVLQQVVHNVRSMFGTDLAMINLILPRVQYFRAWSGNLFQEFVESREVARELSMCQYVVESQEPLIVPDFSATDEFKDQYFCVHHGVRFYAGTPLITSDGHAIGTLCLASADPMEFSEERMKLLGAFAWAAVGRLELLGALGQERTNRKQLTERSRELRDQRDLYRALLGALSGLGEGLVILEGERIVDANEAFARIIGYSVADLTSKPTFLDLVAPEGREEVGNRLHQGIAGERSEKYQETLLLRRGQNPIHSEIAFRSFQTGELSRLIAIVRDITARKRAEQQLRYQSDLTKTIADSLRSGLVALNEEGQIIFANSAAEQILGRTRSELLGEKMHELVYHQPENGDRVSVEDHRLLKAIRSGVIFGIDDDTFTRKDGSTFSAAYTTAPLFEKGQRTGSVVSFRDTTKRKEAEETRARLAAIVEFSDDAIIGQTLEGIITSWNSGAERLYGYTAEEIVGRSIFVLVPADRSTEVYEILERARRGESVSRFETVRIRKAGGLINVALTVSPIIDSAGIVVGASIIARDISERIRLEEMKDSFISTVSHELRTPLTSVKGYLEALIEEEGGPLNEEQREYAEVAYRNATRLQLLVEDLLLLSHLDSGQLKWNTEVLEVGEVLRQVEREFSRVAQKKGMTLAIRAEPNLTIVGDRLRIAQVMSNLVSNALKFTPSGRRVSVSARRWQDVVLVEVADEGVGIPADELPRLTERFFRASSAGTIQGTGLGLAITKDIVEHHGGRLEVESEEGVGSTFRIVLPLV